LVRFLPWLQYSNILEAVKDPRSTPAGWGMVGREARISAFQHLDRRPDRTRYCSGAKKATKSISSKAKQTPRAPTPACGERVASTRPGAGGGTCRAAAGERPGGFRIPRLVARAGRSSVTPAGPRFSPTLRREPGKAGLGKAFHPGRPPARRWAGAGRRPGSRRCAHLQGRIGRRGVTVMALLLVRLTLRWVLQQLDEMVAGKTRHAHHFAQQFEKLQLTLTFENARTMLFLLPPGVCRSYAADELRDGAEGDFPFVAEGDDVTRVFEPQGFLARGGDPLAE